MNHNDIREICDVVREEVLTEVLARLSEMKPDIISLITEEIRRETDSRYASQIKSLESRISKLEGRVSDTQKNPSQPKKSVRPSGTAKKLIRVGYMVRFTSMAGFITRIVRWGTFCTGSERMVLKIHS